MTTFVIPWLLLQVTGSAAQTGIAFAVGFIPYVIVSIPAGVFADRLHRKQLMIFADILRGLALLSIPMVHTLTGTMPVQLLFAVQAVTSGLSALFDAAYGASLPKIVTTQALRQANNTLQTGRSISNILGPIIGGVIMSTVGPPNAILVDVCTYIVSIATLCSISISLRATSQPFTRQSFGRDVAEGFRVVWNIRQIRYLMYFSTLVNLVGPGMDVALLFRLQHELKLTSTWVGIILVGLSAGMLAGSLVNRKLGSKMATGSWLTLASVLQVFPPLLLAQVKSPYVILGIQFVIGVLLVAWNVQSVTLRQSLVPNHLLGRASSVFRLFVWISIPIGDSLAGLLSQSVGTAPYFYLSAGVLSIVAIGAVSTKFHRPTTLPESLTNPSQPASSCDVQSPT